MEAYQPRDSKGGKMNQESRIIRVETVIDHIKYMLERIDARFDTLEKKIDDRFNNVDGKFREMDDKLAKLDGKFASSIYWLIGIGVTSLISVFGAIINIALKLNS